MKNNIEKADSCKCGSMSNNLKIKITKVEFYLSIYMGMKIGLYP